jgi:5-methylcytosine-specific restriction endonuclease McrA
MSHDSKVCARCKVEQPRSNFHKASKPDGLHVYCKTCYNEWRKGRNALKRAANRHKAIFNEDGKICPSCKVRKPLSEYYPNIAREHGVNSYCRECDKAYRAQDRKDKPAKYRGYYDAYYGEGGKERALAYSNANRDKVRANGKTSYFKHVDEYKARRRQHYIENKPTYKVRWQRRRALEKMAEGYHTTADLNELYELTDGRCGYCGVPVFWEVDRDVHIDHMLPISRGGSNWPDNLCIACETCNTSKHDKTPDEWQKVRGW